MYDCFLHLIFLVSCCLSALCLLVGSGNIHGIRGHLLRMAWARTMFLQSPFRARAGAARALHFIAMEPKGRYISLIPFCLLQWYSIAISNVMSCLLTCKAGI
jgi:hypothetical protein